MKPELISRWVYFLWKTTRLDLNCDRVLKPMMEGPERAGRRTGSRGEQRPVGLV